MQDSGAGHGVRAAAWSLAALAAAALMVRPFGLPGIGRVWDLADPALVERATINAEVVSVGPDALRLSPRPGRYISVILPGPAFEAAACHAVEVEAAVVGEPVETDVRVLWQAKGAANFRFAQQPVVLTSSPGVIRFDLTRETHWRGRIARVGVQWAGAVEGVVVRRVEVVPSPRGQRLETAVAQLLHRHPIGNENVNYLSGQPVAGRGLNAWLVLAAVIVFCAHGAARSWRGRRPAAAMALAVTFVAWYLSDAFATAALARQAAADVRAMRGSADPFAVVWGEELAACRDLVLAHVPEGRTIAVLSDDEYYPRNRLAYQLSPRRVCLDASQLGRADFVVVYHATAARFDEANGELRVADEVFGVRPVARLNDDVFLLARGDG